jgi:DNA-binding IclR family transcriptional regulator
MANTERDPVARAFQLLRWMVRNRAESIGAREAAAALAMAPSGAHRLLCALAAQNVLQKDASCGRYSLGLELIQLAHQTIDQIPLRHVAIPHLQRVVDACNEAAYFSIYVRERQETVTIAGVESKQPVRYVLDLYTPRPLYVGAAGWAVLAFLPRVEQGLLLSHAPAASSPAALKPRSRLDREMEQVRARGYAVTFGTRVPGAVGIGVPVFDAGGTVFAAAGIAMPEQRYNAARVGKLSRLLSDCARAIMTDIGVQSAGPQRRKAHRSAAAALPSAARRKTRAHV